jgi:hypothetical protein
VAAVVVEIVVVVSVYPQSNIERKIFPWMMVIAAMLFTVATAFNTRCNIGRFVKPCQERSFCMPAFEVISLV